MPIPSTGTVHQQLTRAQEAASGRGAKPELLVAWTSPQVPVATTGGTCQAPHLLLAVRVPERVITAYQLVTDLGLDAAAMETVGEALGSRH
ncbi:hypothetical protein [Sphingomonas bacterium]|uniref:hypothetical protein n=1 Tax=Sphingomonas bacterium TaxID=1895847 RepID=UPI0015765A49|nr:hypothetical protein [Sphingomonas bacterium]